MAEIRSHALSLVPDMLAVDPAAGIFFDETNTTAGLNTRPDDEAALLACRLSGQGDTAKVAFTTEAGLFHDAGIAAVVCGPGDIRNAHQPDEYIALDQVARCETFLRRLLAEIAA